MTTRNPQPTAVSNTLSSLVPHPALWRHGVLGVLFFWIAVSAIADSYAPNWEDPAFINNITIVLAPRTDGREGLGTSDEPLNASGERFDRIVKYDLRDMPEDPSAEAVAAAFSDDETPF